MKCPECGGSRIYVTHTRHDTPETIIRYRRCFFCSHKWFTVEAQCQAKFTWHKDIRSSIPKAIQREPFTAKEREIGQPLIAIP